ncbi:hypothetical protein ULMS_08110 [Patiriisocius marinistellae]|uniref:Uncharacterized protein n=1 Tax=Patiriisocius marinistellae TaxID=2494560 RepID=A0A5J4FU83_9FLAO|nr:tetratricopeptide repeat protein [Patiriisocius marinistellae]GEQ85303.1 hypothetical protein ULMS_08110 [Patiriisocius marinistellae]
MKNLNNISEEQLTVIDRFLNKEMVAAERLEFETKLNDDPIFRNLVDQVREMRLGIESAVLKEQLNSFHEEIVPVKTLTNTIETSSNKSLTKRLVPFSIAASIVAAIGIFMFMNQGSTNEKLFAKHFNVDPGLPTVMSNSSQYEFYEAMVDYKQEKYTEAISKWKILAIKKPNNDTLTYFLGVAQLANNNPEVAILQLEKTIENTNSQFINDAYFYLGLAYLKNNDVDKARAELEKSNLPDAKKLLEALKP